MHTPEYKLKFDLIVHNVARYTNSDIGNERAKKIIPKSNIEEIRRDLVFLDEMKSILEREEPLTLDGIKDIRTILHRSSIEGGIVSGKQIRDIYSTICASRYIKTYLKNRKDRYPNLWDLANNLYTDSVMEHNINEIVNEEGNIKDSASPELQEIRKFIRGTSETLRKRLENIVSSLSRESIARDEIITTRDGRMVIPVRVEMKQKVPGFIHGASSSGATVFIEPADTLEINNVLREKRLQEQREIERVLKTVTKNIGEKNSELLLMTNLLAEIDFISAKGKYSIEIIGVRPRESKGKVIRLIAGRHPILLKTHNMEDVVPLTLTLGENYTTLIISGPNAGGKSVALQTVGLISLMYQSGLHVPADSGTELPVFNKIFVSIGDEQSVEHDLSTFSSHIMYLNKIVTESDNESLVLIDEIGGGTDPRQGSALAASILEHLTEKRILTIVTTHHGDLKTFAYEKERVENGAMEFDNATLTPTYKFSDGRPGSSYAFEIAERMKFPDFLINRGREYAGTAVSKIEKIIENLEKQSLEQSRESEKLREMKITLKNMIKDYEVKLNNIKNEERAVKKKATMELKTLIDKTNSIIEHAVREIKESSADSETVKKWRQSSDNVKDEVQAYFKNDEIDETKDKEIHEGDSVIYYDSNEIGEVIEVDNSKQEVVVVFNFGKMKIPIDRISKRDKPMVTDTGGKGSSGLYDMLTPDYKIDIRGNLSDEGVRNVEQFIDRAYLVGLKNVEIIHGKGEGVLRKRISEYLKTNPHVKSFRLGDIREGGSGVTIVELDL